MRWALFQKRLHVAVQLVNGPDQDDFDKMLPSLQDWSPEVK
jgi:hypothetical protein